MKKLYYLLATTLFMGSCTYTLITPDTPNELIGFCAVNSQYTKAPVSDNFTFKVLSKWYPDQYTTFDDGTVYFEDVCSKKGLYWETEIPQFWPKTGTLTFEAYSPTTLEATLDANGFSYDSDRMYARTDVLYTDRYINKTVEPVTDLLFHHTLSAMEVNIRLDDSCADANVEFVDMFVNGIKNKAHFCSNNGNPEWTAASNLCNYQLNLGFAFDSKITTENKRADFQYYIPQELYSGENPLSTGFYSSHFDSYPNGTFFEFVYSINGINQYIAIPIIDKIDKFEIGKKYIFNIVIKLDKILFNPMVEDWEVINYSTTL